MITALADVGERDDAPDEVQLGGAEVLTYREMMRRAAPLMGRRPPPVIRVPVLTPRLSSYWVALVTPVSLRADQAARGRAGRGDARRAAAAARAQRRTRWASTTRCAKRWHEAAQPPGRAAHRQRGDRRPRAAHRDGRRRRGPLDPGRERRHARGRAARAVEAGQPRAARPHLLEVPQPRDARDHPRHLHRAGARRGRDRPPARAAALQRARVRHRATAAGSCSGGSRTACSSPSATRATWRSTSGASSPTARATRASTSRSRSRTSTRRSRPGSRAGSTCNTQSRIHVLVTHGFLRSLARLELEESAVGALRRGRRGRRAGQRRRHALAGRGGAHAAREERSQHPCGFDQRGARRRAGADGVDEAVEEPREAARAVTGTPASLERLARRPRPRRAAGRSRR